jgi:hypothetical protein
MYIAEHPTSAAGPPGATRFYLDRFRERVRTEHPRAVLLAKEKMSLKNISIEHSLSRGL